MSFTGSAKRIRRAVYPNVPKRPVAMLLATVAVVVLIFLAWWFVLGWYLLFGAFLIPSRLSRRRQVLSEVGGLRHREIVEAIRESG